MDLDEIDARMLAQRFLGSGYLHANKWTAERRRETFGELNAKDISSLSRQLKVLIRKKQLHALMFRCLWWTNNIVHVAIIVGGGFACLKLPIWLLFVRRTGDTWLGLAAGAVLTGIGVVIGLLVVYGTVSLCTLGDHLEYSDTVVYLRNRHNALMDKADEITLLLLALAHFRTFEFDPDNITPSSTQAAYH
jgi:hypothetical protein